MNSNFHVYNIDDWLNINVISTSPFYSFVFYVDGQHLGSFFQGREFNLNKHRFHSGSHLLYVIGTYFNTGVAYQVQEGFIFQVPKKYYASTRERPSEFRAGDILVACDNVNGLPPHYRPKSAELGQKAAQYAEEYLAEYQEKLKKGINKPKFSFWPKDALDDPWGTIYCSKLVWLCYYYAAGLLF